MLQYIQELSSEEQEKMQDVLGRLFRQTYLLERTYDKKAGRLVINKDYYFCEKHMDFLKDYLETAGIRLESSTDLGTIYIQGTALMGERLPKLATIYLLLLKLIYDEQMASASSSTNIVTSFGALNAKAGEFRLIRGLSSITEIRRALAVLKKYQMIEPLDALEELQESTRILIYPCINLVLMREDIRALLAAFEDEENVIRDTDPASEEDTEESNDGETDDDADRE